MLSHLPIQHIDELTCLLRALALKTCFRNLSGDDRVQVSVRLLHVKCSRFGFVKCFDVLHMYMVHTWWWQGCGLPAGLRQRGTRSWGGPCWPGPLPPSVLASPSQPPLAACLCSAAAWSPVAQRKQGLTRLVCQQDHAVLFAARPHTTVSCNVVHVTLISIALSLPQGDSRQRRATTQQLGG